MPKEEKKDQKKNDDKKNDDNKESRLIQPPTLNPTSVKSATDTKNPF
jgi:hypothetical protein